MVDKLINTISREAALFEHFLKLLEQQQEALVNNDLDALKRVTVAQHEKVLESQELNREREELLRRIKEANEVEGDLTVSRLLDLVDRDHANQLSTLRESILQLNERILKMRNQNAMLLNKSREYIRRTMEMLARISTPDQGTYTASGPGQTERAALALDRRA